MAGRGLVRVFSKSIKSILKPKNQVVTLRKSIGDRCNKLGNERPSCDTPCGKKCFKPPKKPPPCPKRPCLPPVHMCPYDDPCFHCPYTPPPCPKRRDPCCKEPCCPAYNPYKYRDICCRPRHPDRLIDPKCPDHCQVKRKECCPCVVCNDGPLKSESQHNFSCCPPKPPAKEHCCLKAPSKKACPTEPECKIKACEEIKIPCLKQRGTNGCDSAR